MTDRKLLIYVGFPCDLTPQPSAWANRLFHSVAQGDPFRVFVSGGSFTDETKEELASRQTVNRIDRLDKFLEGAYPSRLVPSLQAETLENIVKLTDPPSASSEFRVLTDLWVLARADVYLGDLDLLGRGRCGMELLYANVMGVETVGVSDTSAQDPWTHYHLGRTVRPHDVLPHLWQIRDHLEVVDAKIAEREAEEGPPEEESDAGNDSDS